jgi:hypothetical protein
MADDERHTDEQEESSLELPSLRSAFRRGRRPKPRSASDPAPASEAPVQDSSILPVTQPTTLTEEPPPPDAPSPVKRRRRLRLHVPGPLAAVLTGLVVGLALVGLTAASLKACTSMRDTSTCGTPGILLLLVVTAAVIVLGALLLRLAGVGSPGSTSFLGAGLLVVLLLLALISVLDHWWVVIVVPALAMLTYAAAWWLTSTYAGSDRPTERPARRSGRR